MNRLLKSILGTGKFVVAKPEADGFSLNAGGIDISSALWFSTHKPVRIADRLYELEYGDLDYAYGIEYGRNYMPQGACSAIRVGNYAGGNLDWYYGEEVEFIVKTPAVDGRYATIGVAHSLPKMTKDFVDSGEYSDDYKALPFMVNSAMNTCGVYAKTNVVWAGDKGTTTGTNPGKPDICQLLIPRYVCDYAATADEAIALLQDCNVFAPLKNIDNEIHVMICDATKTYIVEFVNNQMVVTEDVVMTNFYQNDWTGDIKAVIYGDTKAETEATGLNRHAMGLERMKILLEGIEDAEDEDDAIALLKDVKYSQAYDLTNEWYTEFLTSGTGPWGELTIYSESTDFSAIMSFYHDIFESRKRDKLTWLTNHTAVYDLVNKKVSVFVEEDYTNKYEFKLHVPGTIDI